MSNNFCFCKRLRYILKDKSIMSVNRKMTLDQIKKIVIPACKTFNVKRLGIFGSYATGTMNRSSDIDFIVEFNGLNDKPSKRFFGLLHFLEEEFRCGVDMVMPDGIKNPYFRNKVMIERIDLYEG